MLTVLALLTCLGAGIIGGVFFAFSTFVMRANQGVAAMQQINVVVINPLFLGSFIGTAVLAAGCIVAAFFPWSPPRSALLLAAGLLYLVGTFFVTIAFNVPRNNRLAALGEESSKHAAFWPTYVAEWTRWNHVRTVAAIGAAVCSAGALTT